MVPEPRHHRDRRGPICTFDLLFQVCFITAALLMIGSVIFSAFTVRMELNAMRKHRDEQLGKLELQLERLAFVVESELRKRDSQATHIGQVKGNEVNSDSHRAKKRGKSAQRKIPNGKTKVYRRSNKACCNSSTSCFGSKSYGILFAKKITYIKGKGIATRIDWISCADKKPGGSLCPQYKNVALGRSGIGINAGGIYYLSCQLTLRENGGIVFSSSRAPKQSNCSNPKFLLEIFYEHSAVGSKTSLLSLAVQDENEKVLQLSGLAYIPVNAQVSVHLRPFSIKGTNSINNVTQVSINTDVRTGSYFSLLLVKPGDGSSDQD